MINISKYEGLIRSIATKYTNSIISIEDLVQEGYIGVLAAHEKYDPEKGASFETYASYWIKKKILAFLDKEYKFDQDSVQFTEGYDSHDTAQVVKESSIELPKDLPEIETRIIKYLYEEEYSLKEIAEKLGMRREKVRGIREKALRRLRALGFKFE